jgi:hypothetical protein
LTASRQGPNATRQRLAWALAALLLALAGLLAVPQARAAIIDFLQIGGIRIFTAPPTQMPGTEEGQIQTPQRPGRDAAAPTPLASALDLAGETTLEVAQRAADFAIGLPTYPPDLGAPDRVFLQKLGGPLIVLVWTAPGQPDRVILSLHEFGPDTFAEKYAPTVIQQTAVNGTPAVWTEGEHLLLFKSGDAGPRQLVRGHTLIWQRDGITYRLETDRAPEEATRIAESVR